MPSGGISAGSIVTYLGGAAGLNGWTPVQGSFALAASGDNIHIYCFQKTISSDTEIVHLTALTNSNTFIPASSNEADFTTNDSALPSDLPSNSYLELPHLDNYSYSGIRQGDCTTLLAALSSSSHWAGSNSIRIDINTETDFEVVNPIDIDSSGSHSRCTKYLRLLPW